MILLNDFKKEPQELREEELKAIEQVLHSGYYVLGGGVREFESRWAEVCGAKYSIGTANGLDAIEIGLRALGVEAGDEVITTSMSAFASTLGVIRAGAVPVFADIDTERAVLDIESVKRCISEKTKAILLVHLYGQIAKMEAWKDLAKEYGLVLIEDCAQAHLAQYKGKHAGTFGQLGAYSFYPTKNLGALGDAGGIVTNSEEVADKAKVLRNYGQTERYHHPELGMNSRLDELQAAILNVRLKYLKDFTQRRQEIAARYHKEIKNSKIKLLAQPETVEQHVYHLFVVRTEERENLQEHLKKHNIQSLIHYPIPIHRQNPCAALRSDPEGLHNTEKHAEECLSLPCNPQLTETEVSCVIDALNIF